MNKKLLILVAMLLFANLCYAQSRQLTGTITDLDSRDPIAGVSLMVKGTSISVSSNADGKYNINISSNNITLVVSYLGYKSQEVIVGNKTQLNIKLQSSVSQMNEVVIIGYQAVRPRDVTGAITTFDAAKQLKDSPVNDAADALTGRLAGVQITGAEGSLESDPRIVIRGGGSITQQNSPMFIIDGIQVEDGLKSLSPQDIERIDVLKDASSTAIYGSRGANGVIVITTKSGKPGTGTVNYNGLFGVSSLPESLPVMSPYEYVLYQYERFKNSASERRTFALRYNLQPEDPTAPRVEVPNFADLDRYKTMTPVDWQREVMGNTGFSQTHNITVNGGSTKGTRYNFSYSNADQTGIVLNTGLVRNLLNVKLDQTVSDKLKLGFTLRYSSTINKGSGTSSPGNAQLNGLRNFVKYRPYLNPDETIDGEEFNEEEYNATNLGGGLGLFNPVAGILAQYRKFNTGVTNFGGNINYDISPAWSFRSTGGINFSEQNTDNFKQALRAIEFPSLNFKNGTDKSINQSNVLTYTNSRSKSAFAKKNNFTALLGQEIYILQGEDLNNTFRNFPRGITPELALSQLTQGEIVPGFPNVDYNRSTLLSFFGRANYTLKDKYLAAFTLRADGSSKFAEGKRWGYFPSGSFAWRISDEKFMGKVNWVNDVKLRLSLGTSGNNRIGDYSYLSLFEATALYGINDGITSFGYQPTSLPNANLKWETTLQGNVGLDFSFLKNKFQGSIDVYSNRTYDVITNVAISSTAGYTNQLQNTADTWNRGIELQLSGIIYKAKKFSWNADFNISTNKNTVEKLASGLKSQEFDSGWASLNAPNEYLVQVGKSVGNMYGFVNEGFYTVDDFNATLNPTTGFYTYALKPGVVNGAYFGVSQPGWVKIKDLNDDGVITAEDRQIIGNAIPLFFGGINQQFTFGNFDASLFMNFSVGNDILNANKIEFTNGYNHNWNMSKIMENRWKVVDAQGVSLQSVSGSGVITGVAPEILRDANKDAKIWQPLRSTPGYYTSDFAVEDGSFLRLNNITIGYTFNSALLSKIKVKRARFYATANNLGVLTSYSGYDPEVNTRRASGLTPGVDYSAYPRNRSFVFGLNLSL